MPNFSDPVSPVGSYDPCYMTNLYGAPWSSAWNTCIYGRPTQTGADVLCNCTGYAQGRALSIYRQIHPDYNPAALQSHLFETLNGEPYEWITRATAAGFTISPEPRAGSILVTYGHVGIVERYDDVNGYWLVSESGYDTLPPWVFHNSIYESGGHWYSTYATDPLIDGFILIPDVQPGPQPRKKKKFIFYLKNWNNDELF